MTSLIPRALRLGRSRSGGDGKYGFFLILAGLVASAALARRRSRRQVLAGDDEFDLDDDDFRVIEPPRSTRPRRATGTVPPPTPPPTSGLVPLAGSAPRVIADAPAPTGPSDPEPASNPLDLDAATTAELSLADIEEARRHASASTPDNGAAEGSTLAVDHEAIAAEAEHLEALIRETQQLDTSDVIEAATTTIELDLPQQVPPAEAPPTPQAPATQQPSVPQAPTRQSPPDPERPPLPQSPPVPERPPLPQSPPAPERPPLPQSPPVPESPPDRVAKEAPKNIDLPIDAPPSTGSTPPANLPIDTPPTRVTPPVAAPGPPAPSDSTPPASPPVDRPSRTQPPSGSRAATPPLPPVKQPAASPAADPYVWPSEADHHRPPARAQQDPPSTPRPPNPPQTPAPRPGLAERPTSGSSPDSPQKDDPPDQYPSLIDFASSSSPIPTTLTPSADASEAMADEDASEAMAEEDTDDAEDNDGSRPDATDRPGRPGRRRPPTGTGAEGRPDSAANDTNAGPGDHPRTGGPAPLVPDVDRSGRPTWPTTDAPPQTPRSVQTSNPPQQQAITTTERSPKLAAVLPPSIQTSPAAAPPQAPPQNQLQAPAHNQPPNQPAGETGVVHGRIVNETVGPVRADRQDPDGLFYGWVVVGAVFVIMAIASGVGFYNASVILAAATDELNASVGAVSGATSMFFAISGLAGYAFAKQMDSVDLRWFFAIGGLVGAVALVGLQWVDSVLELYIFFAVFGVGFALAGLVPSTTVVTRWFDRGRSVALAVASTGLSVGGIAVTPIAALLIDRNDLAGAAPYLALMWIVGIVPIALLLVRSRPSDMGLSPDGDAPREPSTSPSGLGPGPGAGPGLEAGPADNRSVGLDFVTARSTRFYIALCVANTAIFFGQVGAIAHLFNLAGERTNDTTANLAVMALAGSSVAARLIGGKLVMQFDTRIFNASLALLQAVALVLLAVSGSTIPIIVTAALFGASVGNLLMLQPLLLAEAFGVRNYGQIFGFSQLIGTIGVAGGPLALGVLRDSFDYREAFLAAAVASFAGFFLIMSAGPTDRIRGLWQQGPGLLAAD